MKTLLLFGALCAPVFSADIGAFFETGTSPASLILNPGASQTVLTSAASGFYDSFGNGSGTFTGPQFNPSYFAGNVAGTEFRNYLIFDLSNVQPGLAVTNAILSLANPSNGAFGAPFTYSVNALDLTGFDLTDLISGNGGVSAFADLGDGAGYGSLFLPGNSFTSASITLSTDAITLINAQIGNGFVPLGGELTGQASAVPEPATSRTIALALGGALLLRRVRKGVGRG